MIDVKAELLFALRELPACCEGAFSEGEPSLPLIVLSDAGGQVLFRAEGAPYLEEYQTAVDVYAANRQGLETLSLQADAALSALGFVRVDCRDLYDEDALAYRKHLRYRARMVGNQVYQ